MWEYNYNYGEILQHSLVGLPATNHKYIKKVRGKNGKWIYIYTNENVDQRKKQVAEEHEMARAKQLEGLKAEATRQKNEKIKMENENAKIEKQAAEEKKFNEKIDSMYDKVVNSGYKIKKGPNESNPYKITGEFMNINGGTTTYTTYMNKKEYDALTERLKKNRR